MGVIIINFTKGNIFFKKKKAMKLLFNWLIKNYVYKIKLIMLL